jgi:hypothetical protein
VDVVRVEVNHVGLGEFLDLCSVLEDCGSELARNIKKVKDDLPISKSKYSLSIYDQRRLDS